MPTGCRTMQIVDLRQMSARQLEPLFREEGRRWMEELRWDYRPSLDLIRKFIESRSLAGCAAIENGRATGYGFYVLEEHKGLIGGLFVAREASQEMVSQTLLSEMLDTLRGVPGLVRVEAQLIPFGESYEVALRKQGFRLHTRQFMLLELARARLAGPFAAGGLRAEPWSDRAFDPAARLIRLAYADHVDGEINDQYRSEEGAHKFLRNIVLLPGCGKFQPFASYLIRTNTGPELAGLVLTSEVAKGVGHTTQVCVLPGYQGHGLGRQLMEASIASLRGRRFEELSLTVTSTNQRAVRLYEALGFQTIKRFAAGVWTA